MSNRDTIPHCRHGYIILGCPDEECPEQNRHLEAEREAMDAYYLRQEMDARSAVRAALGLPQEGRYAD